MRSFFLTILIILSFSHQAIASEEDIPKNPVKFNANVISVKGMRYLALSYENHPHWHTYWKNPGDAGLPIQHKFKASSQELKLEPLEWPSPQRYIEKGNIWAYGYEGEYSLFFKIPKNLNGKIEIHSDWLVCKHICIPGFIDIVGKIDGNKFNLISSKNEEVTNYSISKDSLISPGPSSTDGNKWLCKS